MKASECPHTDKFGTKFKIGDKILIAKNSDMQPAYVLGWADSSLRVSCFRRESRYSYGGTAHISKYVGRTTDVSEHNSMQNISKWGGETMHNTYILSSSNVIPEKLQEFIKRGQL